MYKIKNMKTPRKPKLKVFPLSGILICLFLLSQSVKADTFTVTTTLESGTGSLAEAMYLADINPGADIVNFNIPDSDHGYNATSGIWNFILNIPLPYLTGGETTIDGTSQPGYTDYPILKIACGSPQTTLWSFGIFSPHNIIKGFNITGFEYGLIISETLGTGNTIEDCFIGTDYSGISAAPNNVGILLNNGATENIIQNNIISGNLSSGVLITGKATKKNFLYGNYIGTDITGTHKIPNLYGVTITKGSENHITDGNLISGNTDIGILMTGKYTRLNIISGNLIGTDITGTQLLDNHKGIVIKSLANSNTIGGNTPEDRNIISGNLEIGVYVEAADSNRIVGNYIGTDITGMHKVVVQGMNTPDSLVQGNGVEFNIVSKNNVLGGFSTAERNIISGHKVYGLVYYGNCSQNECINNYIGTDVTGENALPNATGICFDCASHHNLVFGCVLSGNMSYGLFFVTRGTEYNTLQACKIGVDPSGTFAVPNDIGMVVSTGAAHNLIGSDNANNGNIISGNHLSGIMITNQLTEHNTIKGNHFGTDASGTIAVPNLYGVMLSTFTRFNTLDNNLISGNSMSGIILTEETDSNLVVNNKIGTDIFGNNDLGNGAGGIFMDQGAKHNFIGNPDNPNIIAYNDAGGIFINHPLTKYNRISGNEIHSNEGLGIDIAPFGFVNPNDEGDLDDGPAGMLNFPYIQSASSSLGYSHISGNVDCQDPTTTTIELYNSDSDASGHGEGVTYLGSIVPEADGYFHTFIEDDLFGFVTAITIDAEGNTSEFAENRDVLLGLEENNDNPMKNQIQIYPIPTDNHFYIEVDKSTSEYDLLITDLRGNIVVDKRKIQDQTRYFSNNHYGLQPGTYLVSVMTKNGPTFIKKLILK